ncbi:hypothetical protein BDA99DRAFT_428003, partial [Phascolomyces articulosus]
LKNIYLRIFEHVIHKSHTLSNKYLKECTELSLIIKTWSFIFKEYSGYNDRLFIQWGDSISSACKIAGLNLKLDLKIYCNDKLKLVLATKCHLNGFIESLETSKEKDICDMKFPIVQLMETSCHIS